MARNGVFQLQKLIINYCDFGGSSRGTREFIEAWLPRFKQENPHLEILEQMKRGSHPYLYACYRNGNRRSVGLRNISPDEILRQAAYLRSSAGRKASLQIKHRTKTERPSIQGVWTSQLQDSLR